MEYRTLGRTGVRVSVVGIGGNQFGGRVDETGLNSILDRAQQLGVNFIDTAEGYGGGASEELLGKAMAERRSEFVLATKTGLPSLPPGRLSRRAMVARLEASLRRLNTDHVDLYYLHFPDPGTPLDESLRAMEDFVRSGKVLYPALSNHPAWQVAQAVELAVRAGASPPAAAQNEYHLFDRRPEIELLPACEALGVSLVPHTPLAGGFLTGKYRSHEAVAQGVRGHANERFQKRWLTDSNFAALERYEEFAHEYGRSLTELAFTWLLAHPVVCSVIAGVTSADQLEANVKAAGWRLDLEALAAL